MVLHSWSLLLITLTYNIYGQFPPQTTTAGTIGTTTARTTTFETTTFETTTPGTTSRQLCGSNTWCYYVDLYPQSGSTKYVNVYTIVENVATTHNIFITSNVEDCYYPEIDVTYEEIDFLGSNEYFDISEGSNDTFIQRCDGNQDYGCGIWSTCLADYGLDVEKIDAGDTYQVTIRGSTQLNDLCLSRTGNDNALNVNVAITCLPGGTRSPAATQQPATQQPATQQPATQQPTLPFGVTGSPTSPPSIRTTRSPVTRSPTATRSPTRPPSFPRTTQSPVTRSPTATRSPTSPPSFPRTTRSPVGTRSPTRPPSFPTTQSPAATRNPTRTNSPTRPPSFPTTRSPAATRSPTSPTSFPTPRSPAATRSPTSPPSPPSTGSRQSCGSNTWCYYIDLFPQSGTTTSKSVDIYTIVESIPTRHEVYITSNSQDCLNPSIDVIYEEIDFASTGEYFDVYEGDDNNTLTYITRCNGNRDGGCGIFSTCLDDYDLDIDEIDANDTYQIIFQSSSGLNDLCLGSGNDLALNVELTITCSAFPEPPTNTNGDLTTTQDQAATTTNSNPIDTTLPVSPFTSQQGGPRVLCGTNVWCYDLVVYPEPNITTYETIQVFSETDGGTTNHLIDITSIGGVCKDPAISVIYEEIDFNSDFEYFDVFEEGSLISRCGDPGRQGECDVFATCLDNEALSVSQIGTVGSYQIRITQSSSVHELCPPYSLNIWLTITCGGDVFPQISTTQFTETIIETMIETVDETIDETLQTLDNQCARYVGATTFPGDIDYYDFSLSETSDIIIDACESSYDTWLYFQFADGTPIDDCDDCGTCPVQTQLEIDDVAPGNYRIGIGGWSTDFGNYIVNVYCTPTGATTPPEISTTSFINTIDVTDITSDLYCDNVDCGWSFLCDEESRSCVRDCDSFDIDGYLKCSVKFASLQDNITAINDDIDGIAPRIDGVDDLVSDLQEQLDDINEKIDRLSFRFRRELNGGSNIYHANVNPMQPEINSNGFENKYKYPILNTFTAKDVLVIGLLLSNLILVMYICLCGKHKRSYKYSKTLQEAEVFDDEEVSENEQLN